MFSGFPLNKKIGQHWFALHPKAMLFAFLSLVLLTIIAENYVLSGNFLKLPLSWQLIDEADSGGYIPYRIADAAQNKRKSVALVGGSRMGQAIFSETDIRQSLNNLDVLLLNTNTQTLGQSLSIVNSLELPEGSLVLMQSNIARFSYGQKELKKDLNDRHIMYIDYSPLNQLKKELGLSSSYERWQPDLYLHRSRIALFTDVKKRNIACFILSEWSPIPLPFPFPLSAEHKSCFPEIAFNQMLYFTGDPMTEQKKQFTQLRISRTSRFTNFEKNKTFSMDMVRRISQIANDRKWKFLLIHLPIDSHAIELNQQYQAEYDTALKELEESDIFQVDLHDDSRFSDQDFYDLYHFLDSGREKFKPILIDIINQQMELT